MSRQSLADRFARAIAKAAGATWTAKYSIPIEASELLDIVQGESRAILSALREAPDQFKAGRKAGLREASQIARAKAGKENMDRFDPTKVESAVFHLWCEQTAYTIERNILALLDAPEKAAETKPKGGQEALEAIRQLHFYFPDDFASNYEIAKGQAELNEWGDWRTVYVNLGSWSAIERVIRDYADDLSASSAIDTPERAIVSLRQERDRLTARLAEAETALRRKDAEIDLAYRDGALGAVNAMESGLDSKAVRTRILARAEGALHEFVAASAQKDKGNG
jgi:hypothetical protein